MVRGRLAHVALAHALPLARVAASETSLGPPARLEHKSAGRVRVRVERAHRTPREMDRIANRLRGNAAVAAVEMNPLTGSVLVRGTSEVTLLEALGDVLQVISATDPARSIEPGVEAVVGLVKRADGKVREATAGRLSLRWLVPTAFVAVGVRQLLAEGLTIGAVPWYVLIYYGVDSFLKLYPEHAPQRPDAVTT